MIDIRPFASLGRDDRDWLAARFHFSFADYVDPARVSFGPLRVWNDDRFRPGGGFPQHSHRDMEIITYIRGGAISHTDGMGHEGRVEAGSVQVMSAGTGVVHSEYNRGDEDLTLFQIWIHPDRTGHEPRWETRHFDRTERQGRLRTLVSGRPGDEEALFIHQDAALLAADLAAGQRVTHALEAGRRAYLVPARGRITVNGLAVGERDGVAVEGEAAVEIAALEEAEVVLLDLP